MWVTVCVFLPCVLPSDSSGDAVCYSSVAGTAGRCHCFRRQNRIERPVGNESTFANDLANGPAGLDRQLGDRRGLGVADVRAECRRERGAPIEQLARACGVGHDAADAPLLKDAHRLTEDARGVQGVPRDHRHHDVQFELSGICGSEDRRVASDHLATHLVDHLGHRRVDLAGHDRRTGLNRRQHDLGQARSWSHAQQPQV